MKTIRLTTRTTLNGRARMLLEGELTSRERDVNNSQWWEYVNMYDREVAEIYGVRLA